MNDIFNNFTQLGKTYNWKREKKCFCYNILTKYWSIHIGR